MAAGSRRSQASLEHSATVRAAREALAKGEALALRVLAERLEHGEHEPDRFSVTFQAA